MKLFKNIKQTSLSANEMVDRYTDQPSQLPLSLREKINNEYGRGSIQVFSYIDFDEQFNLIEAWLVLCQSHLLLATENNGLWQFKTVKREDIIELKEVSGLSSNRLVIYGESNDQALLVVRYSHRQGRSLGLVKFLIEQQLEQKNTFKVDEQKKLDESKAYSDKLLLPIKEAQASVAGNQMAVIWRLLSYLKPYKQQVAFGLTGAILMTLVSLIPAYLTAYLIDDLIKPYQSGALSLKEVKALMMVTICLLYTSPSPRDQRGSRMPSSA